MNWLFFCAGLAASMTFAVHTLVGGRLFAAPLLAANELHRIVRLTNYYCWHIVTVLLAFMASAYFFVSWFPGEFALAIGVTALAVACSILSLGLIVIHSVPPLSMPQWLFFAVIATFGTFGFVH